MAAPLRIMLLCTKFGVGGITRHALDLGRFLADRGHEVAYAGTPGAWLGPDARGDAFVELATQDVSGGDYDAALPQRLAALRASAKTLHDWLRRHPVDLIHAHESAPALVARCATLVQRTPIVLTFHGAEPERMRQFAFIGRTCADHVIATYNRGRQDLARLGAPNTRMSVIGVGVPPLKPVDESLALRLRRDLLGDDGTFLVVTVARLTRQKGLDVFIAAARRARAALHGLRFVIVGDGVLDAQLRALAQDAGVSDILTFAGRSDDPQNYLRASDLFLLTSMWEARPYTISEAFQAGLPAVGVDCGGVTELIDEDVGAVVAMGDEEALAREIVRIARDPDLRSRMSKAALARAQEERFAANHVHARIEALYRALVQR
jgi:glycosyltransferase involved in cell wall biosynthesis